MTQNVSLLLLLTLAANEFGVLGAATAKPCQNWRNPLIPKLNNTPDPWFILHNGSYYYSRSAGVNGIEIRKSQSLVHWDEAKVAKVWTPPPNKDWSKDVWAPELHYLNNRWYVYFTADDGDFNNHRMYVLESESEDALGKYKFLGRLQMKEDIWAIDGTVLRYNDTLYFVWSGWRTRTSGLPQNIYIAEMASPTKMASDRVLIAKPEYAFERHMAKLMEGPEALYAPNGKVFVAYSGSSTGSIYYSIGLLELTGSDPLNAGHWLHHDHPFFKFSEANKVYGPGHCSFTKSKDGNEDYIVYHAFNKPDDYGHHRLARAQKFTWDAKGFPVFGEPKSLDTVFPAPSGEC